MFFGRSQRRRGIGQAASFGVSPKRFQSKRRRGADSIAPRPEIEPRRPFNKVDELERRSAKAAAVDRDERCPAIRLFGVTRVSRPYPRVRARQHGRWSSPARSRESALAGPFGAEGGTPQFKRRGPRPTARAAGIVFAAEAHGAAGAARKRRDASRERRRKRRGSFVRLERSRASQSCSRIGRQDDGRSRARESGIGGRRSGGGSPSTLTRRGRRGRLGPRETERSSAGDSERQRNRPSTSGTAEYAGARGRTPKEHSRRSIEHLLERSCRTSTRPDYEGPATAPGSREAREDWRLRPARDAKPSARGVMRGIPKLGNRRRQPPPHSSVRRRTESPAGGSEARWICSIHQVERPGGGELERRTIRRVLVETVGL